MPPNQEFYIEDLDDKITLQKEGEPDLEILNRFLFRRMDGMYGICLDEHQNIHYLEASTEVIPFAYN